eukprot:847020-Alexandrium_andersonii.AAC.1
MACGGPLEVGRGRRAGRLQPSACRRPPASWLVPLSQTGGRSRCRTLLHAPLWGPPPPRARDGARHSAGRLREALRPAVP